MRLILRLPQHIRISGLRSILKDWLPEGRAGTIILVIISYYGYSIMLCQLESSMPSPRIVRARVWLVPRVDDRDPCPIVASGFQFCKSHFSIRRSLALKDLGSRASVREVIGRCSKNTSITAQ